MPRLPLPGMPLSTHLRRPIRQIETLASGDDLRETATTITPSTAEPAEPEA
jgi:hypothetical protein